MAASAPVPARSMGPAGSASGAELAMPILIVNMGGEMLYILEQRLQAQAIVEEKSLRVLQDVISTMLSEKFINELFKPQRMYSSTSTRQIFDRLAHSSIMRLNTSSMDKLYDLMTMGCKYQVVSVSHPLDLYSVCLNHLDALRVLVKNGSSDVLKLVEGCSKSLDTLFNLFHGSGIGDAYLLRYTLARFFQDRRVKVSLFLTENIQAQDGSMIHSHRGPLPIHTEKPGAIRYFTKGSTTPSREEFVKLPNAEGVEAGDAPGTDVSKPGIVRRCQLGTNLYAKDRRKKGNAADASNAAAAAASTSAAGGSKGAMARRASGAFEADEAGKAAAKSALNALASMIGTDRAAPKEGDKFNVVNLFADAEGGDGGNTKTSAADFITFDAGDEHRKALDKQFGSLTVDDAGNSGGDDLLDLMDQQQGPTYDD